MTQITSATELEGILGTPLPRTRDKARPSLHAMDRQWIAGSPLVLIATSDAEGNLDVSPKGDPAGFAKVLDDTTLAIPERPGTGAVLGLRPDAARARYSRARARLRALLVAEVPA